MAALLVAGVVMAGYLYWRSRQKYVLTINGDALTIAPRGDVHSLADAQLGLWPNIGVALHLHSGGRRFILGGRDRQIGPATPLDAPPTQLADARLPASDFDELLRLGGRAAARVRANRLGAFCSPIRRRSSTRVRSHFEKSNDW
jgi:hypothetical protein